MGIYDSLNQTYRKLIIIGLRLQYFSQQQNHVFKFLSENLIYLVYSACFSFGDGMEGLEMGEGYVEIGYKR